MPGNGIAAAAEIAARFPEIAVVMLTVSDSDDHLFAALRAGAQGYLLKDMDPDRLPLALGACWRVRRRCRGRWLPACSTSSELVAAGDASSRADAERP